jgi:hypothetical protein
LLVVLLPARLNVTAFMALRLLHLQNKQRYFGLSVEITTKARKNPPFLGGFLCHIRAESLYLWGFQGVWRNGVIHFLPATPNEKTIS